MRGWGGGVLYGRIEKSPEHWFGPRVSWCHLCEHNLSHDRPALGLQSPLRLGLAFRAILRPGDSGAVLPSPSQDLQGLVHLLIDAGIQQHRIDLHHYVR